MQRHTLDVKVHVTYVLLTQCPLLGGLLDLSSHAVLDLVEILRALDDTDEDVRACAVGSKTPDLAGLSHVFALLN